MTNARLLSAVTLLVMSGFLLAYFARPHASQFDLVTPQQESASYHPRYPSDMNLPNRLMKSYDLAFILVQSPYLSTNVAALEAVREWAKDQFQAHPDFLHPVSLPVSNKNNDTVFGAIGSSVMSAPLAWCQVAVARCLRAEIAAFHQTGAFHSFNKAFFDVFGNDADAALLLARYESDRARQAIDVVLWSLVWFVALVAAVYMLIANRRQDWFRTLRVITASTWGLLAIAYLIQSWTSGHSSSLVAAMAAAALAIYLWRPMLLLSHSEAQQQLVHIRLAPCWIAVAAWFTFSCLAVQILTWLRTSMPAVPDPASLLLSSMTGNFLQDPVQEKHLAATAVVWLWMLFTGWTLMQRSKDQPYSESDSSFATLDAVKALQRSGH